MISSCALYAKSIDFELCLGVLDRAEETSIISSFVSIFPSEPKMTLSPCQLSSNNGLCGNVDFLKLSGFIILFYLFSSKDLPLLIINGF
jgi:hypothetical protein